MKTSAAIVLLIALLVSTARAELPGCNNALAEEAELDADYLKTWEEIYTWFRKYSACDEGAPAEGYSDAVVRTLADRWSQVGKLLTLTASDGDFRAFVLKHIDATTDEADLRHVIVNASRSCPRGAQGLCETIERSARSALSEAEKYDRYNPAIQQQRK